MGGRPADRSVAEDWWGPCDGGGASAELGPAFAAVWEPAEGEDGSDAGGGGSPSIRALTLNILADGLARGSDGPSEPYVPCPEPFEQEGAGGVASRLGADPGADRFHFACARGALAWARRWPRLRALILSAQPDLIGLQEVDLMQGGPENLVSHDKEIRRDLAKAGYQGAFAKKFGRACDGVALFWRTSRLQQAGTCETWRLGQSVHVALAQPLCLDGRWHLTAVCTHLKAGLAAEAEAARLQQAQVLLQRLEGRQDAVVLADLNAHCRPWRVEPEGPAAAAAGASSGTVEPQVHPLLSGSLQSAYQAVLGDEPAFTCWGGWVDREVRLVCDYILTKGCLLEPRRILQVPSADDVLAYAERLPNAEHPTDHVPLVADFAIAQHEEGGLQSAGAYWQPAGAHWQPAGAHWQPAGAHWRPWKRQRQWW